MKQPTIITSSATKITLTFLSLLLLSAPLFAHPKRLPASTGGTDDLFAAMGALNVAAQPVLPVPMPEAPLGEAVGVRADGGPVVPEVMPTGVHVLPAAPTAGTLVVGYVPSPSAAPLPAERGTTRVRILADGAAEVTGGGTTAGVSVPFRPRITLTPYEQIDRLNAEMARYFRAANYHEAARVSVEIATLSEKLGEGYAETALGAWSAAGYAYTHAGNHRAAARAYGRSGQQQLQLAAYESAGNFSAASSVGASIAQVKRQPWDWEIAARTYTAARDFSAAVSAYANAIYGYTLARRTLDAERMRKEETEARRLYKAQQAAHAKKK